MSLASPPGNERDEVRGYEGGSEEEGEDDGADVHLGYEGVFCELGNKTHGRRVFIGRAWLGMGQSIVKYSSDLPFVCMLTAETR